jgi:hypothetical protein
MTIKYGIKCHEPKYMRFCEKKDDKIRVLQNLVLFFISDIRELASIEK